MNRAICRCIAPCPWPPLLRDGQKFRREAEEGTHSAELRFLLLDLARIEETEVRGLKVCRTTLCDITPEHKYGSTIALASDPSPNMKIDELLMNFDELFVNFPGTC